MKFTGKQWLLLGSVFLLTACGSDDAQEEANADNETTTQEQQTDGEMAGESRIDGDGNTHQVTKEQVDAFIENYTLKADPNDKPDNTTPDRDNNSNTETDTERDRFLTQVKDERDRTVHSEQGQTVDTGDYNIGEGTDSLPIGRYRFVASGDATLTLKNSKGDTIIDTKLSGGTGVGSVVTLDLLSGTTLTVANSAVEMTGVEDDGDTKETLTSGTWIGGIDIPLAATELVFESNEAGRARAYIVDPQNPTKREQLVVSEHTPLYIKAGEMLFIEGASQVQVN